MSAAFETPLDTPIGTLRLFADDDALVTVELPSGAGREQAARAASDHPVLDRAVRQLREYFDGQRTTFDLPLRVAGTPFQRQIWAALSRIPYGETRSYADIAAEVGRP